MTERIELSEETPARITVERVAGDLRLRGWDRAEVSAKGDNPQVFQTEDGEIRVACDGDLTLRIPSDAVIRATSIGGDAKITDTVGELNLTSVGGDLVMRGVGSVNITSVGGTLRLKRAEGYVRVQSVGSDATVREVRGDVTLDNVGADLYIRDVEQSCRASSVGSDLVLSTDFHPGLDYTFEVGGDIVCRIQAEANARFRINAGGDLVLDVENAATGEGDDGEEVVFGAGEAVVALSAGGDVRLVGPDEDYMMAINFQLEEDLEAKLSGLDRLINDSLSGLDEMINTQVEQAMRKAERAARKVEQQVERQVERMSKNKGKRHAFGFTIGIPPIEGMHPPTPARGPRAPEPPEDPVSDEERMAILRMVEAKQITVEEAERLLAALEGRGK